MIEVDGMALDQFWECPKCGTQAGMGSPAVMHPPTCSMGHASTECEQVTEGRFRFGREDEDV